MCEPIQLLQLCTPLLVSVAVKYILVLCYNQLNTDPSDKLSITSLLDLPDEPPSPDLPAPYIVASEFQSYIWPLYSRRWTIKFTSREHVILDGELFGEKYSTPYLDRRYLIPTNVEAVKFLEGIREIVASDKVSSNLYHAPRLLELTIR